LRLLPVHAVDRMPFAAPLTPIAPAWIAALVSVVAPEDLLKAVDRACPVSHAPRVRFHRHLAPIDAKRRDLDGAARLLAREALLVDGSVAAHEKRPCRDGHHL